MSDQKQLIYAKDALKVILEEIEVCNSGFTRNVLELVATRVEAIPTLGKNELVRCLCEKQDAPTVDAVEVVHGRWKIVDDYFNWELNCSLCGEQYWIEKEEMETRKPNYCPKCGAKMDGDGNEID